MNVEKLFQQVMDEDCTDPLRRFAELVAADERERIKQENQRCYVERGEGMTDLRRAAERLLEALDDGWIQRDDWVAITLRQAIEQTKNQIPTTLCGPNLEQTLNAAGFYKQREWVSLTDEEIAQVVGSPLDEVYLIDFRRVMKKLKEKNT